MFIVAKRNPCIFSFGAAALFAGLMAAIPLAQAVQRTAQDDMAEREFAIARPDLIRMQGLMQSELARLLVNPAAALSPPMAEALGDPSVKHPSLGDTRVPLHLRLIERQRLILVAGLDWARTVPGRCKELDFSPAQLVDAAFRQHIERVLQCRRQELDRYQFGMHQLNKANEGLVLELKLPPLTQEEMLKQARADTNRQDAGIEPTYNNRRTIYRTIDELFKFVDLHSNEVHFANNQLLFGNDADAKVAHDLIQNFIAAGKLPQ
jgi:hypothetical protein